jgi:hypothetical protein
MLKLTVSVTLSVATDKDVVSRQPVNSLGSISRVQLRPPPGRPSPHYHRAVATLESLQRWQSALADMIEVGTMSSGQRMREQLSSSPAQALTRPGGPLYRFFYATITEIAPAPFLHLWSTDRPIDPALLAVLQPVADAIAAFSSHQELLPQWDQLTAVVQTARLALDAEPMSEPTVDEVIVDILFAVRTNLLISSTGRQGSTQLVATELVRHFGSLFKPITLPLRHFDIATDTFVDTESPTTLGLAGVKYFANRDSPPTGPGVDSLPKTLPAIAKQFAAQSIVSFYTDWEEHYRTELAAAHGCSPGDFRIDYFGDLRDMRHDYAHNRGICTRSARNKRLKWFSKGHLMIPTPENTAELITAFPADELRQKPTPRVANTAPLNINVDMATAREFFKVAAQSGQPPNAALEAALSEWIERNNPG